MCENRFEDADIMPKKQRSGMLGGKELTKVLTIELGNNNNGAAADLS